MDFATFRDADLSAFTDGAAAWRAYGDALWDGEDSARKDLAGGVRSAGWTGEAGYAAAEAGDQMGDLFETRAMRADAIADVLTQTYESLAPLQRDLRTIVTTVDTTYSEMGWKSDGTLFVGAVDAGTDWTPLNDIATRFNTAITNILTQAERIGTEATNAIRDLAPEQAGYVSDNEYSDIRHDATEHDQPPDFPIGQDPQSNADWWASLTEDQQRQYITAYPWVIGMMDGLPTESRDQANRLSLHEDIETGNDPANAASLLEKIENNDYLPDMERYYLLGYDAPGPEGTPDAKVIVSVGNPDLAANTGVYVPGMTTDLSNVGGDIDRAKAMQLAANKATGPGAANATIMWLGYDPPDDPMSDASHAGAGLSQDAADTGAPALDKFINGTHASHDPGVSSHTTIVGHSYGSLLTGVAASQGDGLAVDDIVVVGSPGMGVDNASDLGLPAGHVWAGEASDDDIANYGHNVHGTDPASEDFGGQRFLVDTSGHSGYWTEGSESLNNMGRLIAGEYDQVKQDFPRENGLIR